MVLEGFLLVQVESFNNALERKVRSTRMYCVLEARMFRCYDDIGDVTRDRVSKYVRKCKPTLEFDLAECIEISPKPFTLEESIERMRMRKVNGKPSAFFLQLYPSSKHAKHCFVAEAGGDIRKWIKSLQKASWLSQDKLCCSSDGWLLKVMLDPRLHPDVSKDSRKVALQRQRCPRACIVEIHPKETTGLDVLLFLSDRTGFPPASWSLWVKQGMRASRLLDGHLEQPLEQWLTPFLESKANHVSIEARMS